MKFRRTIFFLIAALWLVAMVGIIFWIVSGGTSFDYVLRMVSLFAVWASLLFWARDRLATAAPRE